MLKNRIRALGLLSGVFSFSIFALVYHKNFLHDHGLIAVTAIFSLAVTNLFFQPSSQIGQEREAGNLSALGMKWYFSLFALLAAFPAPILVATAHGILAAVLTLTSVGLMVLSWVLSGFTSELVAEIDKRINFNSAHLNWSDQIEILASQISDGPKRQKISKLSSDLKFASRTNPSVAADIELQLEAAVFDLKNDVNGSEIAFEEKIARITSLLKEREVILRASRRKA